MAANCEGACSGVTALLCPTCTTLCQACCATMSKLRHVLVMPPGAFTDDEILAFGRAAASADDLVTAGLCSIAVGGPVANSTMIGQTEARVLVTDLMTRALSDAPPLARG